MGFLSAVAGLFGGGGSGRQAVKIEITGDRELQRYFKGVETKVIKKALRKGVRAGAKVLAEKIKSDAPRDGGDYVKTIKVRSMKRSRVRVGAIVLSSTRTAKGDNRFYATFLEYGTSRQAAQPHWRPAAKAMAPRVLEISRAEVIKQIEASGV